jgi:hypothetical protein
MQTGTASTSKRSALRLVLGVVVFVGMTVWISRLFQGHKVSFDFQAGYWLLLAMQVLLILVPVSLLTVGVSLAGSLFRWVAIRATRSGDKQQWKWVSAEGVLVGLVIAVGWLGWSHQDVYVRPEGSETIQFGQPSLFKCPLAIGPCSDVFVPVTVRYTDSAGRTYVQSACENRTYRDTERVMGRTICWSSNAPIRVVVSLPETGIYLFFPEPITNNFCPPTAALQAYLRGEPIEVVERICHTQAEYRR